MSRARPTSRTTALACIFPNVMIWATLSFPYFSVTYWITSSRLSIQKSTSTSGILIRSGLRNRSKSSPYRMGSMSVILRAKATKLPAAEPLPGPTGTPSPLAWLMKSATMRKYPANPIDLIISNSFSSRVQYLSWGSGIFRNWSWRPFRDSSSR